MELNREHLRAIIFYNFRCGLTQQEGIDELKLIFGDETLSRTSICRWYGEFNRGRSSLQYEFCEGCPKSVFIPETINIVRQLIFQDCHMIYREIETTLVTSGISIQSILHEHLTVKKKIVRVGCHTICKSLKKAPTDIARPSCELPWDWDNLRQ